METLTLTLHKSKETKNKVVYGTKDGSVIQGVYIDKDALGRRRASYDPGGHITAVSNWARPSPTPQMNLSGRRAGGRAGCAALIKCNHSPWRWPRWKQLGLFASVGRTQRCGRWSRLDESGLPGRGAPPSPS